MFSRRKVLQLGALAGLGGLASCGLVKGRSGPVLRAGSEVLPKELLKALPNPWRFEELQDEYNQGSLSIDLAKSADLLAIGDGWLGNFLSKELQLIGAENFLSRLSDKATTFLDSLDPNFAKKVFPIGFSPWAMLFRKGESLLPQAREQWDVLLNPELKGKIILPNSPRLVMSIASRMFNEDALVLLRNQAITFDDREALNWIVSGKAKVAVLPLQRCMPSLLRDQRLSIALPSSGSPINWSLLIRPSSTREPLPHSLIETAWSLPSLVKLIAVGFIPPLQDYELSTAIKSLPSRYRSIMFSSKDSWINSWSLDPLSHLETRDLESLWRQSAP